MLTSGLYIGRKKVCVSKLELVKLTYIVLLEECEVTDDSDPHEEGGGSQQDGTEVVRGHVLWRETSRRLTQQTTQRQLLKGCWFFFFFLKLNQHLRETSGEARTMVPCQEAADAPWTQCQF